MNNEYENLDSLLKSFFSEEDAAAVKEDIRLGDEILSAYPAPEPDEAIVRQIKNDVRAAVFTRKRTHRRVLACRSAVVAALFMIVGSLAVNFLTHQGDIYYDLDEISVAGFFGTDIQLSVLSEEIDEIESSILALGSEQESGDPAFDIDELEMEILEVSSTFWRG